MKKLLLTSMIMISFCFSGNAIAIPFGGVEFPDGAVSFADEVVDFSLGSGTVATGPHGNPGDAIGIPDYTIGPNAGSGYFSLGNQGELVLQFTDNLLTTSGDSAADLYIFEVGLAVENMQISISTDANLWVDVGEVSGQPRAIDIDAFIGLNGVTLGALYSYVKIVDLMPDSSSNFTNFAGADIDAVGALSSVPPPVAPVPEPATMLLLGTGLVGMVGLRRNRFHKR